MALAAANWLYDQRHEEMPFHDGTFESWTEKRSRTHPFHYRDGVSIWVSKYDLTPDDNWI